MKTTLDGIEILYNILNVDALNSIISGAVYDVYSPANSELEDVTINAISLGNGNVQRGAFNVNVHVPDVQVKGETIAYKVANKVRIKTIVSEVITILNGNRGKFWTDGRLWVSNISGTIKEVDIDRHYVNVRVEMKLHANYN